MSRGAVRRSGSVLGLLVGALVLTGCAADQQSASVPRSATPSAAVDASSEPGASEPGASEPAPSSPSSVDEQGAAAVGVIALSATLDHVHGLHVRPGGSLLAGTHTGVVEVALDGSVSAVGGDRHDLMGMTGIPGTDTLLSSGHPGAGSALPNPLGLIVSTDAGTTWATRALTGQVDFHALAGDGRTVVGFDGAEGLLVSGDGGTSFERAAAIAPAALAINDGGVWATTADGLQRSTDNAQSFEAVDGAPLLVLVAAGADGTLWGVDGDGTAWRSADGLDWDPRGALDAVEALAVGPDGTGYVLTATTLTTLT